MKLLWLIFISIKDLLLFLSDHDFLNFDPKQLSRFNHLHKFQKLKKCVTEFYLEGVKRFRVG